MLLLIGIDLFLHLPSLILCKGLVAATVGPAVAPAIPGGKSRMPPCPYAEVHRLCQDLVTGSLPDAVAQKQVRLAARLSTPPLPVGKIMLLTTVAPLVPVVERSVRKEATAIAAKGRKFGMNRETR